MKKQSWFRGGTGTAALLVGLGFGGIGSVDESVFAAKPPADDGGSKAEAEPESRLAAVPDEIASLLETPGFAQAHWGLLVVDRKTGEIVAERNADRMFLMASVTKLFTCASALEILGPDFRFETPVHRRGEIASDGTLRGDLILVASGDPSLGGRTSAEDGSLLYRSVDHSYATATSGASIVEADPLAGLDHLAREIKAAGITRVTGEVIVDDRRFEPAEATGTGPRLVTPIVVNDNLIDFVVTPGAEPGEAPSVRCVPESGSYSVEVQAETVVSGARPTLNVRRPAPRRFVVFGEIPADSGPIVVVGDVADPASFARALFIERLRDRGIEVSASIMADNPGGRLPSREQVAALPKVAVYTSPPFREYVKVILKTSQNLHASLLPLLIAVERGKRTIDDGLRIEGDWLRSLDLPGESFSLGGGAGGHRADLGSPRAVVGLLRAMAERPYAPAFETALPILGRDGTTASHIRQDSPVRGHTWAKTGTYIVIDVSSGRRVLLSKSLAGYMETASGRRLVFAVFLNNAPERPGAGVDVSPESAGRLLGRLCEALYEADAPAADPEADPEPASDPDEPEAPSEASGIEAPSADAAASRPRRASEGRFRRAFASDDRAGADMIEFERPSIRASARRYLGDHDGWTDSFNHTD